MGKFPRCFTHIEWQYEREDGYQTYSGRDGTSCRVSGPVSTTLTLRGYFYIEEKDGCLIFKGKQGLGTSCLLDCTEDEMIMIQNFLTTIRG